MHKYKAGASGLDPPRGPKPAAFQLSHAQKRKNGTDDHDQTYYVD
jgi:hypothetical protein